MSALATRAEALVALHVSGDPLILFNIWDPGSARAARDAGARAIATGSWSVAAANGYDDGERMPFDLVVGNVERIAACVNLPLTVDLESGYGRAGEEIQRNVERIIGAGAVGINLEDQIIGEGAMYTIEEQSARIAGARAGANRAAVDRFFINARTDLFLETDPARHAEYVDEAVRRARAYGDAGASGFFVPGLRDDASIGRICEASPLPVNIMFNPDAPTRSRLAELGVARISYGPRPYRDAIAALTTAARQALSAG